MILPCLINVHPFCEVFGCVGEGNRGKRPMMTKIATDKSDVTILTSDNPKNEDPCKYTEPYFQRNVCQYLS